MIEFDKKIIYAIQKLRRPKLDMFFRVFTHIAEYGIMWMVVTVLCFLFRETRTLSLAFAIALALCMGIGELLLKPIVTRKRPFVDDPSVKIVVHKPRDFSHPSGHSTSCFSCAVVLICFDWRFGIVALIFAFAIGFSRIYLFVHYPLDVICGALWGIAFGICGVLLCKYTEFVPFVNRILHWEGFLTISQFIKINFNATEAFRFLR